MPCHDHYQHPEDREVISDLQRRNDELAVLLCEACQRLEAAQLPASYALACWWAAHKRFDRAEAAG